MVSGAWNRKTSVLHPLNSTLGHSLTSIFAFHVNYLPSTTFSIIGAAYKIIAHKFGPQYYDVSFCLSMTLHVHSKSVE